MTGVVEAGLVLGLITGSIAIFNTAHDIYDAAHDVKGLPKAFEVVADRIPLVIVTLELAEKNINAQSVNQEALDASAPVLSRCKENAVTLSDIFTNTLPSKETPKIRRYTMAITMRLKSKEVKECMKLVMEDLNILGQHQIFKEQKMVAEIKDAIGELDKTPEEDEPHSSHVGDSLHDNSKKYEYRGSGSMYNAESMQFGTVSLNIPGKAPRNPTILDPCRCVPFENSVPAGYYSERKTLMQELEGRMQSPFDNRSLAHGAAVVGLGGTGKTQLALNFAATHANDYDTILWFDAGDEQKMRSSFTKCCSALDLPFNDRLASDASLMANSQVSLVLDWLERRKLPDQKWLVIIDNLDQPFVDNELSNMAKAIPRGSAGSVIITSQDENAKNLLDENAGVQVDAMNKDEALTLLLRMIGVDAEHLDGEAALLPGKIISSLDHLAFAVNLAGATIHTDIRRGSSATDAMERYLCNLEENRDRLFGQGRASNLTRYQKNIGTVWNTSLDRVRECQGTLPCTNLLACFALLDRTCIQDVLFDLASLGVPLAVSRGFLLPLLIPDWGRDILTLRRNGKWDDSCYRDTVDVLERYGLVRSVKSEEKRIGVSMHSLVSWRAGQLVGADTWKVYLVYLGAALTKIDATGDRFGYNYLRSHLPTIERIDETLPLLQDLEQKTLLSIIGGVGQVWYMKRDWQDAESFYALVVQLCDTIPEIDLDQKLKYMEFLADTYCGLSQWTRAETLYSKACALRMEHNGQQRPSTLASMSNIARALLGQGKLAEAADREQEVVRCCREEVEIHPVDVEQRQARRPIEKGGYNPMVLDSLMLTYFSEYPLERTDQNGGEAAIPVADTTFSNALPPDWRSITNNFLLCRMRGLHEKADQVRIFAQGLLHTMEPLPDMFMDLVIATPHDVDLFLRCHTPEQLHHKDSFGKTKLHWAAEKNAQDAVQRCLDAGVDIHCADQGQSTALHYAAHHGLLILFELFLD